MWLVDLNFNFESAWLIELSNNKLSNKNMASESVENRSFFKPIAIEEIVICMINSDITNLCLQWMQKAFLLLLIICCYYYWLSITCISSAIDYWLSVTSACMKYEHKNTENG